MTQRYRFIGPFVLALCGSALGVAQAQPDPNQVPFGANPPQAQPQVPPFIIQGGPLINRIRPGIRWGTPMLAPQMQELMTRQQLQASGFTDKALQDGVVEFMQAQEKARGPLRDKAREVDAAMHNNATTDAAMLTLTNALRIAIEAEKARSEAALKVLDAKIGYTKKPRLEAFLLMRGLLDDTAAYLNEPGHTGPQTPFNGTVTIQEFGQQLQAPEALDVLPELQQNLTLNYYLALPGNGAQVWNAPAVPNNALRTYMIPPDALQLVAPPRQLATRGFVVPPPVMAPGDVITPPGVNAKDFAITPPQTPVPLAQPTR